MTKLTTPETASAAARRTPRVAAKSPISAPFIAHQIGGHLALDFCNTAGEHLAETPDEFLFDWKSFLRWATHVGLIGHQSYLELLRSPEPVDAILELREAIYRVGLAVAGARRLSKHNLEFIRERADTRPPRFEVRDNSVRWRPDPSHASQQLCGVLAAEALSLFCSPKAARIGVCEGGNCGWLFLDESRGKKRRWCDMNDCGSRAKARRYYQKHKGD